MKKNVNKIRKEVKGLKMQIFFSWECPSLLGFVGNQSYAKWWHCEFTISLPQLHTSWANIFEALKKTLSSFFFSLLLKLFVIFLDEGIRNKHSAQADEAWKDILIVPAQLSTSVHFAS